MWFADVEQPGPERRPVKWTAFDELKDSHPDRLMNLDQVNENDGYKGNNDVEKRLDPGRSVCPALKAVIHEKRVDKQQAKGSPKQFKLIKKQDCSEGNEKREETEDDSVKPSPAIGGFIPLRCPPDIRRFPARRCN
jgi:hypothetical protein